MTFTENPTVLDKETARHTRRAEVLRQLGEIRREDPHFTLEIIECLQGSAATTNAPATPVLAIASRMTAKQKAIAAMKLRGNDWVFLSDLANQCGISRGSMSNVLYAENSPFESRSLPGHGRARQWRLKDVGAVQELAEQQIVTDDKINA